MSSIQFDFGLPARVEELREALTQEVLKREVVEGPKAEQAKRKIQRSAGKSLRKTAKDEEQVEPSEMPQRTEPAAVPEPPDVQ